MNRDSRPDPLETLRTATREREVVLPEGLLDEVLALEKEATEQDAERSTTQARLRGIIEVRARAV